MSSSATIRHSPDSITHVHTTTAADASAITIAVRLDHPGRPPFQTDAISRPSSMAAPPLSTRARAAVGVKIAA
jgi:hypothetical protein